MAEDEKAPRRPPTKEDASFWADLAFTLVNEITCECGQVNKVQPEWHTGFFRAECAKCYEELDLHKILRTPDRTRMLIEAIDEDKEPVIKRGGEDFNNPTPQQDLRMKKYVAELEEAWKKKEQSSDWIDSVQWDESLGRYVRIKEDGSYEAD